MEREQGFHDSILVMQRCCSIGERMQRKYKRMIRFEGETKVALNMVAMVELRMEMSKRNTC